MARQGGMIEPSSMIFELGWGSLHIKKSSVAFEVAGVQNEIDPEMAPLFRMIANRLDDTTRQKVAGN